MKKSKGGAMMKMSKKKDELAFSVVFNQQHPAF